MASEVTTKQAALPMPAAPAMSPSHAPSAPRRDASSPSNASRSFADELGAKVPEKVAPVAQKAANTAQSAQAASQSVADKAMPRKTVLDDTPVINFLTGHLERLDPASIPGLVAGNEFLGDALGTADLGKFMSTESTVGDLLDALDLPPSFAQEVEKLGVDMAQVITPNELFKALGLDPQRALTELKLLKDNLDTGNLSSYIKRAAVLQGQKVPAAVQANAQAQAQPAFAGESAKGDGAAAKAAPLAPIPALGADKAATASVVPGAPGLSPQAQMLLAAQQPQVAVQAPQQPKMSAKAPQPQPKEQMAAAAVGVPAVFARLPGFDATQMQDLLKVVDPTQLADVLPDPAAMTLNEPATTNAATFDAFALMGDRLRGADGQVLDPNAEIAGVMAPLAAATTPGTQLPAAQVVMPAMGADAQPASMNRLIQQALRDAAPQMSIDPTLARANAALPAKDAGAKLDLESLAQTIRLDDKMMSTEAAPTAGASGAVSFALAADLLQGRDLQGTKRVSIDEIKLALPLVGATERDSGRMTAGDAFTGGDRGEKDDDQGARDGESGSDKFTELFNAHAPNAHGAKHAGEALGVQNAKAEVGMTPAERLDLMQKVVDRAAFLAKDGGGVVRLDLGSAELGRLELAVKMTDDRVDLRILTSSDRVRDIMAAELNRLRDALTVQHVQLGKVEVGVNGRNPNAQGGFNQFAGNGGQGQQQGFFQGQRETLAKVLPARRPAMARPVMSVPENRNGRLQIRA